jgi:hypothetical protein
VIPPDAVAAPPLAAPPLEVPPPEEIPLDVPPLDDAPPLDLPPLDVEPALASIEEVATSEFPHPDSAARDAGIRNAKV